MQIISAEGKFVDKLEVGCFVINNEDIYKVILTPTEAVGLLDLKRNTVLTEANNGNRLQDIFLSVAKELENTTELRLGELIIVDGQYLKVVAFGEYFGLVNMETNRLTYVRPTLERVLDDVKGWVKLCQSTN